MTDQTRRPAAATFLLGLLCLMYFVTYINRANLATAAGEISRDLSLTNTELGVALSAFAYPYLLFQVLGGWIGDRFGPRLTLFACGLVWASATMLTAFITGLTTLFLVRLLLGAGEGATLPAATRAMHAWMPASKWGFAQGITHAFARLGNAITPLLVAWLIAAVSWRGSFIALGAASLFWVGAWLWAVREDPLDRQSGTARELQVPWAPLTRRMMPVAVVYFCYGWTLWLYLSWLPSFFLHEYALDLQRTAVFASVVFFAGVAGDVAGGILTDRIRRRTDDLKKARRDVVVFGFLGSFVVMLPVFVTRDLAVITASLAAAFFFVEIVIGPMWSIPMDIAGKYSGTASGLMNSGSALAAILSPMAFGIIVDATGDWHLPFIGSLALLLAGALLAFTMHPEIRFNETDSRALPPLRQA